MRSVVRHAVRGMSSLALAAAVTVGAMGLPTTAQEPPPAGLTVVAAGEPVLLREQPGYDAVALATLGGGEAVDVVGAVTAATDGSAWVPVVVAGQAGYLPAGVVSSAAPPPPPPPSAPAAEGQDAPEAAPLAEAEPTAAPAPPAAPEAVEPAPPSPAASGAVEPAPAAPPDPSAAPTAPAASTASTFSDLNLRSGPSADADILRVLPPGTIVSVDGDPVDGFVPVTAEASSGWVAAEFLSNATAEPVAAGAAVDSATPATAETVAGSATPVPAPPPPTPTAEPRPATEAPEVPDRAGTGIAWPFAGGTWQVIQGYNTGTHTNRSAFAQYQYALDWARVDGDTAGQPVFAPVSGTIEWVDRGSGGLLMNAGNGYGVALFHVTLDGDVARGGVVQRGQQIGAVSGPGGDGYMSTDHVEIDVWVLSGSGHSSTPFTGPNAIAGQEFPDTGGANQHMGVQVTP